MKTVAIIGAGPSGIVAAKTLLRSKTCQYKVTIFEKASELGGLWAVHKDRPYDGLLNPDMPVNVGRFNLGFSDLAWQSVGLEGHVPYWPRAWQVGQYLRAYADRFLPKNCIRYNTKVISASSPSSDKQTASWKVVWESASNDGDAKEGVFDYLIVASGFFNQSVIPKAFAEFDAGIKVIHSAKLRALRDLLPDDEALNGSILVVGGGMSGADAATVLANQLSDYLYSPDGNDRKYRNVNVVQLCPEPAYALPLAATSDNDITEAPHFLPLDLCFYRLDTRPPGPIKMSVGLAAPELIKAIHTLFTGLVGDQSMLGADGMTMSDREKAAYVTLTEQYSSFVRSGSIKTLAGRLETLQRDESGSRSAAATYTVDGQTKIIKNVIGVVYATGFTPQPSLDFLSEEVREALEHDTEHKRLPVLLDKHATLHSKIPGLAVIGFHEGAFWGTMEMEARLVERHWSQPSTGCSNGSSEANGGVDEVSKATDQLRALRKAMTSKQKGVPQYWLGDYVGQMEQLARETDTPRNDEGFGERSGPVVVSRYADDTCDTSEAQKMLTEARNVLTDSKTKALFTGRAAFLGLQGNWKIERTIISHLNTMPSGNLNGTASFHPRVPTDPAFDFEYLYIEQGTFSMSNGMVMNATRRYAYRYSEEHDKITVWFVKDDGKTVDYMYHGLEIDIKSRGNKGWLMKADHLCIKDMYVSDYRFRFKGANVERLTVTHEVKGPSKDYVSETTYTR